MRNWNICAARSQPRRRFNLHLTVVELEVLSMAVPPKDENYTMKVQVEWRKNYLPRRRSVDRSCTSKQGINSDGYVRWDEAFDHSCKLKLRESGHFRSWIICIEVHGSSSENQSAIAKIDLDIAQHVDPTSSLEKIVKLPLVSFIGSTNIMARLTVKLELYPLQTEQTNSIIHPISPTQLLPSLSSCIRIQSETNNDEDSSTSVSDDEPDHVYRNLVLTNMLINGQADDDNLEYHKDESYKEEQELLSSQTHQKSPLIRLLSWNRTKLSSDHPRDTPLLNKENSEVGGDDIDNDRLSNLSSSCLGHGQFEHAVDLSRVLGSDRFEIGKWEKRKLVSRDGNLELVTEIFLASIDQRSEEASGEGACTVLATVIADWLHQNPKILPIKCQFDKLIRQGSLEWRNLCKEEIHREKFYDKHFDLDTVLQAQIRPLEVVRDKSYIGFFELENMPTQLGFLQGAMSFDSVWEKLLSGDSTLEDLEKVYIVSWKDHFFVLKIDEDEIYMIDTLGERLCEGCHKAYMLKFNAESMVYKVKEKPSETEANSKGNTDRHSRNAGEQKKRRCRELISEGKSTCKEFIKGFLAALPLRELQEDIKKGIIGETPLHHLLQIEFHHTTPCNDNSAKQKDD